MAIIVKSIMADMVIVLVVLVLNLNKNCTEMDKLEIKSPIDILPEIRIILKKLVDSEDIEWDYEKIYVKEARARLKQLTYLIESAGKRGNVK